VDAAQALAQALGQGLGVVQVPAQRSAQGVVPKSWDRARKPPGTARNPSAAELPESFLSRA
jgi:hypothetical protein